MHECLYFGVWGRAGHYLLAPGGQLVGHSRPEFYGDHVHLDSTLAPRRHRYTKAVVWSGQGKTDEERQRTKSNSDECAQGHFLRHELDNGYTAIQWWDRTQADDRPGCNSTILLKGKRTTAEMLAALAEHFPTVLTNLTTAGVELRELEATCP